MVGRVAGLSRMVQALCAEGEIVVLRRPWMVEVVVLVNGRLR